ncbi:unnamed protein product [Mytilus coruscus]|uniref:Mab-21-like HhH/H2TH-like domain-containing protein n=1 Tax=Mytilus coruscus TaxID=42192 RepID=A0A6J8B853_MYTCO|nr:unnamed protein product [Mytilus coruscus]
MTTNLSLSFYHYLCQKLGTEDLVRIRRLCHAICNYVSPMNFRLFLTLFGRTITRVSSGSKAEGLNMKRSDLDIMYVIEIVNVVEDPLDRSGFLFSFLISTEYTKPGFVRLKLHYSAIQVDNNWCKERDGYVFLSSEQVKKIPFAQMENHTDVILHGPCITTANESHDMAFCLRSKSWIAQAQTWVLRNRSTHIFCVLCVVFHLRDDSGVRCAIRDLQRRPSSRLSSNEYCLGLAYYTLKEYHNALSILVPYSEFVKSNYNVKNPVLIDHIYKLDMVIRKLKRELS